MPLNANTVGPFYRVLYAGILQTVCLLKRGDDQNEGVVTSYKLFDCRWSAFHKAGQPIKADLASSHNITLHIPTVELTRNGVYYINVLDRFVDKHGWYWQPESGQTITVKLFEMHNCINCLRIGNDG